MERVADFTCPFWIADQSQSMESQEPRHLHLGVAGLSSQTEVPQAVLTEATVENL